MVSNTAPITAEPKLAPSWRLVLVTPEASPASCTDTADNVILLNWAWIKPMPKPNKAKAGAKSRATAVGVRLCRNTISPAILNTKPAIVICLGLNHFDNTAETGPPMNRLIDSGNKARPVCSASKPRTP